MEQENKKYNSLSRYIDLSTIASVIEAPTLDNIGILLDKLDGACAKMLKDRNKGSARIVKKDYTSIVNCPVCEFRLLYSYNDDDVSILKDGDITTTQLDEKEDVKQVCETLSRVLTRYTKEHSIKLDPSTRGFVPSTTGRGPYNKDPLRPTKIAKRIKNPNRMPVITLPQQASHGEVIAFVAPNRSCPGRPLGVKIPEGFHIVAKETPEPIPEQSTPPVLPAEEVLPPSASSLEDDFTLHIYPGFVTDIVNNHHKCTQCSQIVKTPAARRKHICGEEQKHSSLTCRYCNDKFQSKRTYYHHITICETEHQTPLVSVPKELNTPIQYKHSLTPHFIQSHYTKSVTSIFNLLVQDILIQEVNGCFKRTCRLTSPKVFKVHRGYNRWEYVKRRICCIQAMYSICTILIDIIVSNHLTTQLYYIEAPQNEVYRKIECLYTLCNNIIFTIKELPASLEDDNSLLINRCYREYKQYFKIIDDQLCVYKEDYSS